MQLKYFLIGLLTMTVVSHAQARSCMVVGEKTAKVQSQEGQKSPVFHTQSCESLRLISGKAMVSWVSRDGKAHFAPIGPQGVDEMPSAGAEERAGNLVWAEVTSVREATRPAFMRAIGAEAPTRVFVPQGGLMLPEQPGAELRVLKVKNDQQTLVLTRKANEMAPIVFTHAQIQPGETYKLEWRKGEQVEQWTWLVINENEAQLIEAQLKEIDASVSDPYQRRVVTAMLFEQRRLKINRQLALQDGL